MRSLSVIALCAGVVGSVAGCGQAPAGAGPASKAPLVIYAAEGYDQAMANAFSKATGIPTQLKDMSTGPLIAAVEAEKNNPQWDVAWFDGDGSMYTLDQAGVLQQNWATPANIPNLSRYDSLGKSLQAPDGSYIPTGVTAAGAIAHNTNLVPASEVPSHWSDLLKPFFKGAVGMDNPAISGPTFPLVAGFLYGKGLAGGEQFFSALKANGLKVFPTNKPTLTALSTGAIKVAIAQDSAEIQALAQGAPIRLVYPAGGVTMLPGALGIARGAKQLQEAEEFANFVLSAQGQQVMLTKGGGDSNFQPIVTGEQPNSTRQATGIQWNRVPVAWQAQNYNTVQTWFKDSIAQ